MSAAAQAAPADGNSVTVSFADLDLASSSDASRLERRLRHAANRVCGSVSDSRDLKLRSDVLACREVAMNSARPRYEMLVAAAQSTAGQDYASLGGEKIGR